MGGESSSTPRNAELLRGLEHLSIEDAYFQAWGRVGGAGRLRQTFSLSAEFWDIIEFQIRKEQPGISHREARRQTGKRVYLMDDAAQSYSISPGDEEWSGLIIRKP